MSPVETINGGAVRLFDPTDSTLGICEGIETAIAVHELFGIATWAALSTAGMEAFEPQAGLCHAIVYADNDGNFAGQKAAYVLANRLIRTVPEVEVMVPPEMDTDWLDVLNERRHRGAA
jgi:putative DNA primase/helicase